METAVTIAQNWEKLGSVGICLLAVALLGWAIYKTITFMLDFMRAEIERRETVIRGYHDDLIKLCADANNSRAKEAEIIERNSSALRESSNIISRCSAVQQIKQNQNL